MSECQVCNSEYFRAKVISIIDRRQCDVKDRVDSRMRKFASSELPTLVNTLVKINLTDNAKVNEILGHHSKELEEKLDAKSREIMTRVVNEPQFNTLTKTFFSELGVKNKRKMVKIKQHFNNDVEDLQNAVFWLGFASAITFGFCVGTGYAVYRRSK